MPQARTRLKVEQRRGQLLELGRALFSTRPYEEISVDEIAAAAGISKGLLYHYFPGKRELYLACVRESVSRMQKLSAPDPALPPMKRLEASLDGFIAHIQDHTDSFLNLLRGGDRDPEVEAILAEGRRSSVEGLARSLGLEDSGHHTRLLLFGFLGFANYTCLGWARTRRVDRAALRRMLVDALCSSLRTAAELEDKPAREAQLRATLRALEPG